METDPIADWNKLFFISAFWEESDALACTVLNQAIKWQEIYSDKVADQYNKRGLKLFKEILSILLPGQRNLLLSSAVVDYRD